MTTPARLAPDATDVKAVEDLLPRASIAQLLPGEYHVVLKGARSGHAGAFKLRIRDNDWWADTHRLECDDNDGGGTVSLIERTLDAADHGFRAVRDSLANSAGPSRN